MTRYLKSIRDYRIPTYTIRFAADLSSSSFLGTTNTPAMHSVEFAGVYFLLEEILNGALVD